jgi:hypothetical protein
MDNVLDLSWGLLSLGDQIKFGLAEVVAPQLPDYLQNDKELFSRIFCSNNGFFKDNFLCECDIAFFGYSCEHSGIIYWGKGWTAIQVIFSLFYVILTFLTWNYLRKSLKKEYGGFWKKIWRLINTPKYLVILNLIIICTSKKIVKIFKFFSLARMVYISVDPFKLKGIFDRSTDRVLHEIVLSTTISIFFILLIVWMGLYTAFDIENKNLQIKENEIIAKQSGEPNTAKNKSSFWSCTCCFRHYYKFKNFIIFILMFIYPFQIIFSYLRGKRTVESYTLSVVFLTLFSLTFLFIIIFIYYTSRLKYTLSKSYEAPNKNLPKIFLKKPQTKINKNVIQKVKKKEMKEFLQKVEHKNILNLIVRQILDPKYTKRNDDEDSDSELDYEDEMENIDLEFIDEKNDNLSDSEANPKDKGNFTIIEKEKENKLANKYSAPILLNQHTFANGNGNVIEMVDVNAFTLRNPDQTFGQVSRNPTKKEADLKIKIENFNNTNVGSQSQNIVYNNVGHNENHEANREVPLPESNRYNTKDNILPRSQTVKLPYRVDQKNRQNLIRKSLFLDKHRKEFVLTEHDMTILNKVIFDIFYFLN